MKPNLQLQLLISLWISISLFVSLSYAEKLAILFTGETHSALYPCYCPSKEGGLARRMTVIKQLREKYPNLLLLDSGGMFAGGILDEYSLVSTKSGQDEKIDMRRTEVNMEAASLMGYNAIAVGDEELNFGTKFLKRIIKNTKIPFLSCNLDFKYVKPYIIIELNGVKIGIMGVTPINAKMETGVEILNPEEAIRKNIKELQREGADFIILLSHLGESKDKELIKKIDGINIILSGNILEKNDALEKVDSTILLRPSFQGRRIRNLVLTLKEGKIEDYTIDEISLNEEVPEAPEIASILPRCFGDDDCKKSGLIGKCINPGKKDARCIFVESIDVPLLIIRPRSCRTCNTETAISDIKKFLPKLNISYLDYETKRGQQLVKKFKIKMLPGYILGEEVERVPYFARLKDLMQMEKNNNGYMLPPSFTGVSYFLGRKKTPKRLDLFVSPLDSSIALVLKKVNDFLEYNKSKIDFNVHFVAFQKEGNFIAPYGIAEVEEDLRQVCIMKYYPNEWLDYALCRSKRPESSWWDDCAENCGIDIEKIKSCAKGKDAERLLQENIKLTEELEILRYPIFLLNNQEIFGITESTNTGDLEKIIFGKD